MFKFFKNLFDYNQRQIKRYQKIVAEINSLEDKVRSIKDKDFPKETEKLRQLIDGQIDNLNKVLPWAFALVREVSRRSLNQRHFDVQLMAGIALHEGKVVEQKTGEGKTLSATTALYLNALTGKGVHLVTVNDYLARRDCGWMGKIFYQLGLKTSAIIADKSYIYDPNFFNHDVQDWRLVNLRPITRKEAYLADIVYGVNSEFGFDYLRDNMAQSKEEQVQRGFYFAIIDEADSILIDEARTPHIISSPFDEDVSKYYQYAKIVKTLNPKTDFVVDEKLRTAYLTDYGISKVEKILGSGNIYEKNFETLYYLEAALKAETLFKKDRDYIIKDGQVIIIDEFTGRLLEGRRFSEGIHQAIEAKEGVAIKQESKTLATISLQNYFRMYQKLSGMTGTAVTEAEEFNKIYRVDVVVIPTHRPMIRKDHPDVVYKTEKAKFNAVVDEIIKYHQLGRPILIGTVSIEKNEFLSSLLKKRGIPHQLLNAKNHEKEAAIIARAGEKGMITVATNMAGRGVDIILGGMPPNPFVIGTKRDLKDEFRVWHKKHQEVVNLGGLYVIGTEKHESRRIDNQLRGRAGRQGDPGDSRFFVSLEDDLMRIFGGEQISKLMTFFNLPDDTPLSHPMVTKVIEQAQIKVEGFNFDIRKHLVEFDDVMNKQREIIYKRRQEILESENPNEVENKIKIVFEEVINLIINNYLLEKETNFEVRNTIYEDLKIIFSDESVAKNIHQLLAAKFLPNEVSNLKERIMNLILDFYHRKEKEVNPDLWWQIVKTVYLSILDHLWMTHLTAIEDLRQGINLRSFGQLDPLVEYKNEAYGLFERLINNLNFEVIRKIFSLKINFMPVPSKEEKRFDYSPAGIDLIKANPNLLEDPIEKKTTPFVTRSIKKIGRNDPCWCGSGKKYKKCHYPN